MIKSIPYIYAEEFFKIKKATYTEEIRKKKNKKKSSICKKEIRNHWRKWKYGMIAMFILLNLIQKRTYGYINYNEQNFEITIEITYYEGFLYN